MAKKNDQNEDPENKKKQFDDDEDFGLPDLEYDALEEEADMDDDEPINEDLEAEVEAEVEMSGSEETPAGAPVEDEVSLEGEDWEKELEKELEDDLKSGKFQEEVEAFYEEESYSDFETEETVKSSVFGIDEKPAAEPVKSPKATTESKFIEEEVPYVAPPKPKNPSPVKPTANKDYVSYYKEDKSGKSKFARTVVIGVLLFTVVAIVFMMLYKSPEPEQPKVVENKPAPVEVKEEPPVEKPVEPAKPTANQVVAGQISKLDQKTGKAYIVVASFFDGDMAQDHANVLSAAGKSPYIIPPFNDYRFYRVAIAEFDTFSDAKNNLDGYKAEYGQDIWPLRY